METILTLPSQEVIFNSKIDLGNTNIWSTTRVVMNNPHSSSNQQPLFKSMGKSRHNLTSKSTVTKPSVQPKSADKPDWVNPYTNLGIVKKIDWKICPNCNVIMTAEGNNMQCNECDHIIYDQDISHDEVYVNCSVTRNGNISDTSTRITKSMMNLRNRILHSDMGGLSISDADIREACELGAEIDNTVIRGKKKQIKEIFLIAVKNKISYDDICKIFDLSEEDKKIGINFINQYTMQGKLISIGVDQNPLINHTRDILSSLKMEAKWEAFVLEFVDVTYQSGLYNETERRPITKVAGAIWMLINKLKLPTTITHMHEHIQISKTTFKKHIDMLVANQNIYKDLFVKYQV